MLFDIAWLRTIENLLDDKRQVIFQGPSGTGKTYVARKLAECLAGSAERVRLVQFHPSYAYEDFVHGIRPPDRPPVQGLLARWLEKKAPHMTWIADVVDRANRKIMDDRQAGAACPCLAGGNVGQPRCLIEPTTMRTLSLMPGSAVDLS